MRKTLSHNLLITELFNQLTFPVKVRTMSQLFDYLQILMLSFSLLIWKSASSHWSIVIIWSGTRIIKINTTMWHKCAEIQSFFFFWPTNTKNRTPFLFLLSITYHQILNNSNEIHLVSACGKRINQISITYCSCSCLHTIPRGWKWWLV